MEYLSELIRKISRDKLFFKSMLALALPVALQNMIQSGLNMVDTLMIGQLGETEIAAVALSNQIFFLLILILFGISSGASVFASQYWGSQNIKGLRESLALSLLLAVGAAVIFAAGALFVPAFILSIYSADPEVIRLGASYLRIVGISYPATAITFSFSASLRSTGRVKLTTVVSGISIGVNTSLNFLLIFGIGPFPAMGVEGAALATVIARIVEMLILLYFVYKKQYPSALTFSELFQVTGTYVRRYLNTSIPVILNEMLWSFGITAINLVFARISTEAMASFSITDTISKLFMVFFFGTSGACAVMVGNRIGAGEEKKAVYYAHSYAVLGPFLGLVMGLFLFALAPVLPMLFNITDDARHNVTSILRILALFMPVKIFNWHLIVGILRSGGDTKYSMFMEGGGIWFVAVPAAAITGLIFHLPLPVIYFALTMEELVKFSLGFARLRSGRWLKNVIS